MKQIYCMALLFIAVHQVMTYNILMMATLASRSHKIAFDPIAEALAEKGHKVTFFSPIPQKQETPGVQHVFLENVSQRIDGAHINYFQGTVTNLNFLSLFAVTARQVCNATFHDEPAITQLLKDPKGAGYDVLVMDGAMNDWLLAIGHHLDIPVVVVMPAQMIPLTSVNTNIPTPPYVFHNFHGGENTFMGRLLGTLVMMGFQMLRDKYIFHECEATIQEVLPGTPPIAVLEKKISFLLSNSHTSIHSSIPAMPYFVEVGCLHCKKAKPLPEQLDDFMQSSGDAGVIYFSLGSITSGTYMPLDMRDKIIGAFSRLPQRVIWKYEADIEGLPKNIKLTKWAPQQDILAHNKTRLFISHGGGLSNFEAAYHGCPILGFPLSADQFGIMSKAVAKGYAESLDWKEFTEEELYQKIMLMLSESRYQERVDRLSSLLKDRPQEPVDTAVYWIEYVIRHKGAPHLKSGAEHLNFFQYFLLDVIAVIIALIIIALLISFFLLRKCFHLIFKPKSRKLKSSIKTD